MQKQQVLAQLNDTYEQWNKLLSNLAPKHASVVLEGSNWSIKDEVAHLLAWLKISIERLEAAQEGRDPQFPAWRSDPTDTGEPPTIDQINERIYAIYRDTPWPEVYQTWQEDFRKFVALAEALPEEALLEVNRYAWLKDHALIEVLEGTYKHHQDDHLTPLLTRLETL
jgi:hypothetical protein